jgi:hypothetical protein
VLAGVGLAGVALAGPELAGVELAGVELAGIASPAGGAPAIAAASTRLPNRVPFPRRLIGLAFQAGPAAIRPGCALEAVSGE